MQETKQLIAEAIQLYEQIDEQWDVDKADRIYEIWETLKAPYVHLYSSKKMHGGYLGDEVGPGWWQPLLECLQQISDVMQNYPYAEYRIGQIKEKFGGIRFYGDIVFPDDDDEEDAENLQYDLQLGDIRKQISGPIRALEKVCDTRCETCGEPGKSRNSGWIKTLCDKHHEKRQRRILGDKWDASREDAFNGEQSGNDE